MNKTILETPVFLNTNKTSEKAPDFTSSVETLLGKLNIAIWKTKSKSGTEYFNLKISTYDAAPTTQNDSMHNLSKNS
jgi:hypothetical protein